ncbi:MAG: histidine phosphatase family protein [Caulobacteraceae bacterium]|nr:histidine phosphatase family protein [Caulobacteraceae bacterium]
MHRLILLRHGKAESVSATGGDFDRGLTERGRRDSALIGRVLAEAGVKPDLVLVSAARRTQETWDELARAFPDTHVEVSRQLYLASCEQLEAAVDPIPERLDVMIVGHNPGLHEFALALARRADVRAHRLDSFPTAAAAVFRIDGEGEVALEGLYLPREHGGGPT